MLWFFEKHQSRLHYEIRHQTDGTEYELVITHPDGRQDVEHYRDAAAVLERSIRLQDSLIQAGWQPPPLRARGSSASKYATGARIL
jgi:hypothetical protein